MGLKKMYTAPKDQATLTEIVDKIHDNLADV